jgi:hypothetical protein
LSNTPSPARRPAVGPRGLRPHARASRKSSSRPAEPVSRWAGPNRPADARRGPPRGEQGEALHDPPGPRRSPDKPTTSMSLSSKAGSGGPLEPLDALRADAPRPPDPRPRLLAYACAHLFRRRFRRDVTEDPGGIIAAAGMPLGYGAERRRFTDHRRGTSVPCARLRVLRPVFNLGAGDGVSGRSARWSGCRCGRDARWVGDDHRGRGCHTG